MVPFTVASAGYGLGLLAHLGLALYLARSGRSVTGNQAARWPVVAALLASAAWCGFSLLGLAWRDLAADYLAQIADLARYGFWFLFLVLLLPHDADGQPAAATRLMRRVATACTVAAALLLTLHAMGALEGESRGWPSPASWPCRCAAC